MNTIMRLNFLVFFSVVFKTEFKIFCLRKRITLCCIVKLVMSKTPPVDKNFDLKIRRNHEKNSVSAASMSRLTIVVYLM